MRLEVYLIILLPFLVKTSNITTELTVGTTTKTSTTEMNSTTEIENAKKKSKTGMIIMMSIAPGIVISVMSGKMIYSRRKKKCLLQNNQGMQAAGNDPTADACKGENSRMILFEAYKIFSHDTNHGDF